MYWGAGEPLGQSLVVPAVKRLAQLGAEMTLITFEKPADADQVGYLSSIRRDLEAAGVRWLPLRYHKSPRVPATLFDCLQGVVRSLGLASGSSFDIVHARTFIGGLMGRIVSSLLGAKYIFHNEGFYPDEQVDGGFWRQDSTPHRVATWLEQKMYATADAIIVMSRRAREIVKDLPEVRRRKTPVAVVPSCVDLDLFNAKPHAVNGSLRLVYSGSVGGRYILDRTGRFVAVASRVFGDLHLRVLSRAAPALVGEMLRKGGLSTAAWSLESVPYVSMPSRLAAADAGIFFLSQGLSEHGCSPTKVGEYWAMGLPVVTTPNVSDLDEIIERERVGVIVRGHSDDEYQQAASELAALLTEPELGERCRRAAEEHYSLERGCQTQDRLYKTLSGANATEVTT